MPNEKPLWHQLPFFEDMDPADIGSLARHLRRLAVPAGTTLFRRGERARTMFVIVDGFVEVVDPTEDGRNVLLAELGPGETMGEVALLDGGARRALAIARTPVMCLTLDADGLADLLRERPETALKLMLTMSRRLALRLNQAACQANRTSDRPTLSRDRMPTLPEVRRSILDRLLGN